MEPLQGGIKREKDAVAVCRCPGPGDACMESSSFISSSCGTSFSKRSCLQKRQDNTLLKNHNPFTGAGLYL